ncbi:MAG: RecX family transcriptional regulator [Odoribacteraceae bacterium]|jgi:regulatory protein|nr:RecX family transcriptional regulator [Odoribacteraceae bacterium]
MEVKKALQVIAARCSRREYASLDVIAWLQRQALTEEEVAACMAFLREHRFVDDARFARAYARDKSRLKRWGHLKIEQALRQKHLPNEVIAQALASIKETGADPDTTCLQLLQQKGKWLKETDPGKRKVKLTRFALGRGFDHETVRRAIAKLGSSPA